MDTERGAENSPKLLLTSLTDGFQGSGEQREAAPGQDYPQGILFRDERGERRGAGQPRPQRRPPPRRGRGRLRRVGVEGSAVSNPIPFRFRLRFFYLLESIFLESILELKPKRIVKRIEKESIFDSQFLTLKNDKMN